MDKKIIRGLADVVFCFDCRASMQPYIGQVKQNVNALVEGFDFGQGFGLDWQVRSMGYRSFNINSGKFINHHPFVKDANDFALQLDQLVNICVVDEPGPAIDAIWYALKKTSWREDANRFIILFTDATPLPVHEDTISDLGIGSDDVELLKQELMIAKIKLFMFCKTDPVYDRLNLIPKAHKVQYDDPDAQLATIDFEQLMEQIGAKIVSHSIGPAEGAKSDYQGL
jgi:hypothetical protein